MHYTLGKNPYGYRGLGDIFVFIFFGVVSCCGTCYICGHEVGIKALLEASFLPGCAIGCFSVGVLNVNNIRDMITDAAFSELIAFIFCILFYGFPMTTCVKKRSLLIG